MNIGTTRMVVGVGLGAILSLLAAARANAQTQQIAQVEKVSGEAYAKRAGSRVNLKIGDPLYEKDTIDTGADGSIGITFIDNTVMSAGPNSEVSLEEYTFDSNNFKGSMLTDMHKGTLSMVSGDIAKSSPAAMKVKTPQAILGVRGTHFVVQVPD